MISLQKGATAIFAERLPLPNIFFQKSPHFGDLFQTLCIIWLLNVTTLDDLIAQRSDILDLLISWCKSRHFGDLSPFLPTFRPLCIIWLFNVATLDDLIAQKSDRKLRFYWRISSHDAAAAMKLQENVKVFSFIQSRLLGKIFWYFSDASKECVTCSQHTPLGSFEVFLTLI